MLVRRNEWNRSQNINAIKNLVLAPGKTFNSRDLSLFCFFVSGPGKTLWAKKDFTCICHFPNIIWKITEIIWKLSEPMSEIFQLVSVTIHKVYRTCQKWRTDKGGFALEHNNNLVLCLMITNWILTFSSPVFTFIQLQPSPSLDLGNWQDDLLLRRGSCYVLPN